MPSARRSSRTWWATMPSDPRPALDLWTLMRVYTSTFEILLEANLQLPCALMGEWARMARL